MDHRPHISPRERELLALVMDGLTNREIARRMHLREQTIKNYLKVLCEKLHVRNRVQLAVSATRLLNGKT